MGLVLFDTRMHTEHQILMQMWESLVFGGQMEHEICICAGSHALEEKLALKELTSVARDAKRHI